MGNTLFSIWGRSPDFFHGSLIEKKKKKMTKKSNSVNRQNGGEGHRNRSKGNQYLPHYQGDKGKAAVQKETKDATEFKENTNLTEF
jgi:hypothetical protein